VADEFGSGVGFDHLFVDLLGQLVLRKRLEGAAEGGFAGDFTGTVPAAELPQHRARPERVDERAGGGKRIDVLGDEGVRQPGARSGRGAVAAPLVTAGEAAQIAEGDDLAELFIQGGERPEFRGQRGKSWRCR